VDVARVEAAIGEVESDPKALEAVKAVLELHGEALARIVERVDASALAGDELVEEVLALHDLGPRAAVGKAANGGEAAEGVKPQVLHLPVAGQEPPEQPETCELCGTPVPAEHRHMLDLRSRELMCTCQACRILFDSGAAGGGHYRLVPDRRLRLADFEMDDVAWEELRIPVDMAFFFFRSDVERVVAYYPSPAGPTESLLELDAWQELERANPLLGDLEPDVEALLVNRSRGARQYFVVPIDDCYALVGLIRTHWRGLTGGREVWEGIEAFFEGLSGRSKETHIERGEATWRT
jgi:hypothetical protein